MILERIRSLFGPASIDEAKYQVESRAWDHDWRERLIASERRAWRVAFCAVGLSILLGIAIASMAPLKRTDTYMVRVDNATGIVEPAILVTKEMTPEELVTKGFIWRYVRCRENYLRATIAQQYDECALLTAPDQPRRDLLGYFDYQNPKGPYARYGEQGIAEVTEKTISFIAQNVARMRFYRTDRLASAEKPIVSHWEATIVFQYAGPPHKESESRVNPFGFQVVQYRLDPETVSDPVPAPQAEVKQ